MSPEDAARLADIRRRIVRFRATPIASRVADPGYALTCLADQAFLLRMLDATAAIVPQPAAPTPPTAFHVSRAGFNEWNAAVHEAEAKASVAFAQGLARRDPVHDIRGAVLSAIAALARHAPASATPTAVAPILPTDPPPFHA